VHLKSPQGAILVERRFGAQLGSISIVEQCDIVPLGQQLLRQVQADESMPTALDKETDYVCYG